MTVLEQGSTNLVDFGPFGVKGFVIGVTNEPKKKDDTSTT